MPATVKSPRPELADIKSKLSLKGIKAKAGSSPYESETDAKPLL